jgi:heterotetrameric sarcosine oxidase gamma subunit
MPVSKPERRSILDGHLIPGHHGALGGDPVELRENMRDAIEITVRTGAEMLLRKAVKARLKLDLPAVGRWRESDGWIAFGTGPGIWSMTASPQMPGAMIKRVAKALGDQASVVETGHGLAFLTLSGPQSRQVLAKGCRLDLHSRVFVPGHVARTVIAQIPVTLWQIDGASTFGLAVPVTFAQGFVHFLLAASAETGCIILPASKD